MKFKSKVTPETIISSLNNLSHDPKRRGNASLAEHEATINDKMEFFNENSKNFNDDWEWFCNKADNLYASMIATQSGCASSFITGPSNFPVRQQEKRHNSLNNKRTAYLDFLNNVEAKIIKKYKKKETPTDRLEKYKEDLKKRTITQEFMKACNKIMRSKKSEIEKIDAVKGLGATQKNAETLVKELKGFEGFELSNNRANIKRIEGEIKKLETKASKENKTVDYGAFKLVINYEIDRFQLLFDGKPNEATRTALKSNGFKWSPRHFSWQNFLTENTKYKLRQFFLQQFAEANPFESVLIGEKYVFTTEDIDHILVGAFEGGCNYWLQRVDFIGTERGDYASDHCANGGFLGLKPDVDSIEVLHRSKVIEGIRMHYKNVKDFDPDNFDAVDYDCIIQYALFREIVFG